MLAITTLSFDIAGLELYLPLTVGARVVIASNETARDGNQLSALMNRSRTTIMQATPATWRMLLDSGWKGNPGLKILCGGESWSAELASELLPTCGSLWNMYGPTETTIWSSVSRVEKDKPVRIGKPIANTTFYVLDRSRPAASLRYSGRALYRWRWLGAGLFGKTRPDKRALRARPVQFAARSKAVQDGRSGADARRRLDRVPPSRRSSGQASRLPH